MTFESSINEKEISLKKEYSKPMLTTHGDVQALTQIQLPPIFDGSGPPRPV